MQYFSPRLSSGRRVRTRRPLGAVSMMPHSLYTHTPSAVVYSRLKTNAIVSWFLENIVCTIKKLTTFHKGMSQAEDDKN